MSSGFTLAYIADVYNPPFDVFFLANTTGAASGPEASSCRRAVFAEISLFPTCAMLFALVLAPAKSFLSQRTRGCPVPKLLFCKKNTDPVRKSDRSLAAAIALVTNSSVTSPESGSRYTC